MDKAGRTFQTKPHLALCDHGPLVVAYVPTSLLCYFRQVLPSFWIYLTQKHVSKFLQLFQICNIRREVFPLG